MRQGLPAHSLAIACLVAAGAALAYVAALASVSVASLERAELGFQPANVLEVSFPRRLTGSENGRRGTAFQRWLDVRDLPGVVSSALATGRPLQPSFVAGTAQVPENPACVPTTVRVNYVTPEYFRTVGVRIHEGDAFSSSSAGAPRAGSSTTALALGVPTVVNEALMRRWRACGATLGTRVQVTSFPGAIMAIAGDTVDRDPRARPEPQVYFPLSQDSGRVLLVKHRNSAGDDRLLRQTLTRMFPGADVTALTADVARAQRADRSRALALQLFSGLGIVIAALGLLANQTALLDNRRREMALRLALGAGVSQLRRRIVIPAAVGALAGAPAGVLIGMACGRIGESLFVGVTAVYVPGIVTVTVSAAAIASSVALYGSRTVGWFSPASVLNEAS